MLDFFFLMLMPKLMKLALTPMLLLDDFDVDAYAVANNANADVEMPNIDRHLVGACDVLVMPTLLPMPMLIRHLMRANAYDNAMLTSMCIFLRLCLSTVGMCVCC